MNRNLYESTPRKRALLAFCDYFLELQSFHMEALLLLESRKNLDMLLIIRSMLEGMAQLVYVRRSGEAKKHAVTWWNFSYPEENKNHYWCGIGPTKMIRILEDYFEKLGGAVERTKLTEFYAHFAAYHHWNRTNRMARRKEDSFSLGYGMICLRYTIETVNELMGLGFPVDDVLPR